MHVHPCAHVRVHASTHTQEEEDAALVRLRRDYGCLMFEEWIQWVGRTRAGRLVANYGGSIDELQQANGARPGLEDASELSW